MCLSFVHVCVWCLQGDFGVGHPRIVFKQNCVPDVQRAATENYDFFVGLVFILIPVQKFVRIFGLHPSFGIS